MLSLFGSKGPAKEAVLYKVIQGSRLTQSLSFLTLPSKVTLGAKFRANGKREVVGNHMMNSYGPGLEVAHPFLSII